MRTVAPKWDRDPPRVESIVAVTAAGYEVIVRGFWQVVALFFLDDDFHGSEGIEQALGGFGVQGQGFCDLCGGCWLFELIE